MRNTESAEHSAGERAGRGARNMTAAAFSSVIFTRGDLRRVLAIAAGLILFLAFYLVPFAGDLTDPNGNRIVLTQEGRGAIGLVLLAIVWWAMEAAPIGITAVAVGMFQAIFGLRPAVQAFHDFMDPSVLFIFGSIVMGIAIIKSGLARRAVYGILGASGERCAPVLLGCMAATALLAHFMPHTAAAACIFPILLSVNDLYGEGSRPNAFGKSLFIGMAYAAGAGSIATMLGSARTPAAMAMFREFAGADMTFGELSKFMLPLSWVMLVLIWAYLSVIFKSGPRELAGLRESARDQLQRMGPFSRRESTVAAGIVVVMAALLVQPFVPVLQSIDKTAVFLVATVAFFLFGALGIKDLEEVPWNIILLYGGAVSLSFCLWQTGAAGWLGLHVYFLFSTGIVLLACAVAAVLVLSNLITNVAVLAALIPVFIAAAKYGGIHAEPVFYACLAAAGMPFVLRMGSAPNAIAYESRQFDKSELFRHGVVVSAILIAVILAASLFIWPLFGMAAGNP